MESPDFFVRNLASYIPTILFELTEPAVITAREIDPPFDSFSAGSYYMTNPHCPSRHTRKAASSLFILVQGNNSQRRSRRPFKFSGQHNHRSLVELLGS